MRRLLNPGHPQAVNRSAVLTVTLTTLLGALTIFGFASQAVQDRDAAITQAIQSERARSETLWRDVRSEIKELREDLKALSEAVIELRVTLEERRR